MGVDVSVIVRLRALAKDAALAAFAASKPGRMPSPEQVELEAVLAIPDPYDPARHRALQRHITVTIPTSSGPVVDLAATQRIAASAFAPNAEQTPPDNKKVTAAQ